MKEKQKRVTLDLCYIALSIALITVCSWISIPVSPSVKYTLQLVAVFTCCGLFGLWKGVSAVAIYTLMGLIGIPVFAGFAGGPSITTGFVIGFIPTALVVGCIKFIRLDRIWKRYVVWAGIMLVGLILCYAVGTVWFVLWGKGAYTFADAITFTILPYWGFDLVKIGISVVLVERLQHFIK